MKRKPQPKPVNHERWLVSYADFITLLFAFFVVLFASSQADKKKQAQLGVSIESAFNQMGIFDGNPKAVAVVTASEADREADLRERLMQVAGREIGLGMIAVHESKEGLVVSLQEAGFFESGSAEVRAEAQPVLDRLAAALPDGELRVEGHTDDVPIRTAEYASNWELSSARASRIARLLLLHPNVHPEQISVAGYAEFHPIASNATAAGRAQNRRVDLVILRTK